MLRVQDIDSDGLHTCLLTGRLDRASAPAFAATIVQLCEEGATGVALDLGNLKFVDSAGLDAISLARDLCESHGCDFSLTPLSRAFNVPSRDLDTYHRSGAASEHQPRRAATS